MGVDKEVDMKIKKLDEVEEENKTTRGGGFWGQGHGALLKSHPAYTAAWLALWQRKSKENIPVTLAWEDGKQLGAHKVILAAASPPAFRNESFSPQV